MLKIAKSGSVARVTLDRPEIRNAFDDALISALTSALRELDAEPGVRAVVLAGSGPAFCAGGDLNWMKRMAGYSYHENLTDAQALADLMRTLDRMRKPTIARVHGPAYAGGVGLVAACDIAIGVPEATFCLSSGLGLSPATIGPPRHARDGERMAPLLLTKSSMLQGSAGASLCRRPKAGRRDRGNLSISCRRAAGDGEDQGSDPHGRREPRGRSADRR
jgi:methylglutaconyl-CoA hydratase